LTPRALAALRAVAATLVPEGGADLADRVAERVAALPRPADRAELDLLLRLFESRVANLLLAGTARPFSALAPAGRDPPVVPDVLVLPVEPEAFVEWDDVEVRVQPRGLDPLPV